MCLIEGSLYTSEGLLLFSTVNTTATLIFSFYLLSLSLSFSVFSHIFSVSDKSMDIILNQDVFTDFPTLALCYQCQLEKRGTVERAGSNSCVCLGVCVYIWESRKERETC